MATKTRSIIAALMILTLAFALTMPEPAHAGLRRITMEKKGNDLPTSYGDTSLVIDKTSLREVSPPCGSPPPSSRVAPNGPAPIEFKGAKLRGTVQTGIFRAIAIVEDTVTGQSYWYRVGDTLCGAKVVDIKRGGVIVETGGSRYIFGLPDGSLEATSGELAGAGMDGGAGGVRLGKAIGENRWEVRLDDAITMLTRAASVMKEARIRPYFAVGKAAGIRVDRIKDESVIGKMGLQDGDVIKGVNGFGLMSPKTIFEAYRKYKDRNVIQVELLRQDEPVTLTYNIIR